MCSSHSEVEERKEGEQEAGDMRGERGKDKKEEQERRKGEEGRKEGRIDGNKRRLEIGEGSNQGWRKEE